MTRDPGTPSENDSGGAAPHGNLLSLHYQESLALAGSGSFAVMLKRYEIDGVTVLALTYADAVRIASETK